MALTPQIDSEINNITTTTELPSKTYKLNTNVNNQIEATRIIGFVDNLDAVRQAIYHILMTERYAYLIYDDNYGIELEQYIGRGIEYLKSTIEETLKEALTYDLRILDVIVNEINEISTDIAEIKFQVISIYGDLQMEVNINV